MVQWDLDNLNSSFVFWGLAAFCLPKPVIHLQKDKFHIRDCDSQYALSIGTSQQYSA